MNKEMVDGNVEIAILIYAKNVLFKAYCSMMMKVQTMSLILKSFCNCQHGLRISAMELCNCCSFNPLAFQLSNTTN